MEGIRKRNHLLAAKTGLCVLAGIILLFSGSGVAEPRTKVFLAGVVIAVGIGAGLWLRGVNQLKIARLISENPILQIYTSFISDLPTGPAQSRKIEKTDVIISYFGILLAESVIKFNQGGIRLWAVEIGNDSISFTYGSQKRTRVIRLLRPATSSAELNVIAEKIHYETGITPTIQPSRRAVAPWL